jgi:NADPH-dependent curcumin reductase CurA
VIDSRNEGFAVGDHVTGLLGVQEYAISSGQGLFKVDAALAPLPLFLGTLGMTGMTAYFGLLDVGQPKPATRWWCPARQARWARRSARSPRSRARVVGIAGGADKCRYLVEELGFDAAIDYKSEDVAAALKQHCPNGVSVFFDNVGGEILDAVLAQAGDGRARGDLRRHLAVQQSGNGQRPGQLPANYGEARHAARRDGVRLLPARQGSHHRHGGLDPRRQAENA